MRGMRDATALTAILLWEFSVKQSGHDCWRRKISSKPIRRLFLLGIPGPRTESLANIARCKLKNKADWASGAAVSVCRALKRAIRTALGNCPNGTFPFETKNPALKGRWKASFN